MNPNKNLTVPGRDRQVPVMAPNVGAALGPPGLERELVMMVSAVLLAALVVVLPEGQLDGQYVNVGYVTMRLVRAALEQNCR
jgi:hypothetical protein